MAVGRPRALLQGHYAGFQFPGLAEAQQSIQDGARGAEALRGRVAVDEQFLDRAQCLGGQLAEALTDPPNMIGARLIDVSAERVIGHSPLHRGLADAGVARGLLI